MISSGVGVDPRPDVVGGAGGGAGASNAVSVRSCIDGQAPFPGPNDKDVELRLKTLGRWAGRRMAHRMLDGARIDWDETWKRSDHGMRKCGWKFGSGQLFHVAPNGKARVKAERCGNARVCPVCGPAQAAVRAAEVGAAVWRWMTESEDHHAIFVSTAASHRSTDKLEDIHHQWLAARAMLMKSDDAHWKRFRKRYGIYDMAWKIEHSVGPNGPHVGLHLVFLTDRWWEAEDAQSAEAWLWMGFERGLKATGYKGRLSPEQGIDIRPVDDPAGIGKYLTKWGVGQEMASEANKLGRNGVNLPYAAIPAVLAQELGRRDPYGTKARAHRDTRMLVDAWADYVRLAKMDGNHWYRGFRKLKTLVPELKDAHRAPDKIAVCTEVLPEELRPERYDDSETDEEDAEGLIVDVDEEAWEVAVHAWYRADRLPYIWARRRLRWLGGRPSAPVPLELAILWMIEDEGVDEAAAALADLCGGTLYGTVSGLTIQLEEGSNHE